MCVQVCVFRDDTTCMWKSEDSFQEAKSALPPCCGSFVSARHLLLPTPLSSQIPVEIIKVHHYMTSYIVSGDKLGLSPLPNPTPLLLYCLRLAWRIGFLVPFHIYFVGFC